MTPILIFFLTTIFSCSYVASDYSMKLESSMESDDYPMKINPKNYEYPMNYRTNSRRMHDYTFEEKRENDRMYPRRKYDRKNFNIITSEERNFEDSTQNHKQIERIYHDTDPDMANNGVQKKNRHFGSRRGHYNSRDDYMSQEENVNKIHKNV